MENYKNACREVFDGMKRKLSLLLAIVLVVTMVGGMSVPAFANEPQNHWDDSWYDTGVVPLVDESDSKEIFYIQYGYGETKEVTFKYYFDGALVLNYSSPFGSPSGSDGVGTTDSIASAQEIFYMFKDEFPGKTEDDIEWKTQITWDGVNLVQCQYFFFKNTNPNPGPSPAPAPAPGHNHEFVTEIVSEPNEMSDGEEVVRCKICGYELERNPISAYGYALNSYAPRMLNAAKTGDNVTLDFKEWNSFPKSFMEQIKAKVDAGVTVTFKYKYNHVLYEITIPAYSKVDTSLDWYGPMCMYQIYVLGVPVAQ